MTKPMDHPAGFQSNEVTYKRFEDDVTSLTEADIPLRPENRRKTDRAFTYIFATCMLLAIVLFLTTVIIVSKHGVSRSSSSKFGMVTTEDADDTESFVSGPSKFRMATAEHMGVSDSFIKRKVAKFDISEIGWKLALTSFISLGLTVLMAALYRHATAFVVWGILIVSWAYFFVITVILWYINIENIVLKLVCTFVTLLLLCVLVFMKDRVRLVTMLFKEATKATFDMQAVFAVPVVTILLLLVATSIYFAATMYMGYAGAATETSPEYISSDYTIGSIIFNTIITIWILEFFISIQYLIVSGAVSKWYFTRNKELLGNPVSTSFYVTMRYHIGTAALGSLIITIVAVIRAILRYLSQNSRFRVLVNCCMAHIENFIRFFTKNALIVTAMHGTPFFKSGKHAVKLLTLNLCNTIAINSLGDFVLSMSAVLIVGLSVGISFFILDLGNMDSEYVYYCLAFVIILSLICSSAVLGTFETSFSTMFLCVCQDFLINNGNDKPYAMTRDLMEFLDDSKKVFAKTIEKKNLPKI